jgi:integrase
MSDQRRASRATLSKDQLRQILSISQVDPRLRDLHEIASFISFTGIRPGELQNLCWSNVDVHKNRAFVTSNKVGGHYLAFGAKALQILEARRGREAEANYVLGASARMLLNRISRQLSAVGNRIGTSPVSLSVLRKTFIFRLLHSGADVRSVMILCGYRESYPPSKFLSNRTQIFECAARNLTPLLEEV